MTFPSREPESPVPPASGSDGESQRFLTAERVEKIGRLIEPLISQDLSWIDRRKQTVEILDDTALRRQISVDFSLRRSARPLLEAGKDDDTSLFCAPVYVLPKAPANLMAFDLEDEGGNALSLIGREDNARISSAVLARMARRILQEHKKDLPNGLDQELRRIAQADAAAGTECVRRVLNPAGTPWEAELKVVGADDRFVWWLRTLGHSSIVAVLYRARRPGRKLVKLRFEQPIASEQRRLARLGWSSYRVGIDSPLIEARRFHLEAQSPPGLRITKARFTDDGSQVAIGDSGFLRRVHLYRPGAERAGAGTAVLWLRVSGQGFIGGAPLAAGLVTLALTACWASAREIATNPTSAPALLVVLPGLIATYIGRADQHALTTRLLSTARRLLLFAALLAYTGAAKIALGGGPATGPALDERMSSLRLWLGVLALASLLPLIGLGITWLQGRVGMRSLWLPARVEESRFVAAAPERVFETLRDLDEPGLVPPDYDLADQDDGRRLHFVRTQWHGDWVLTITLEPSNGDCIVLGAAEHVSRLRGLPVGVFVRRRAAADLERLLEALQAWARPNA